MTLSEWDGTAWAGEPVQMRSRPLRELQFDAPTLTATVAALRSSTSILRRASVAEALSVPAIQRAVTLISHTVGSLSMQGWRAGSPMPETPIVLARPNPYETPQSHYRDVGYYLATRGESVGWIANRDGAGFPIAIVNVPPWELTVKPNPDDRLRPSYRWGDPTTGGYKTGRRYSLADPEGRFVHVMYHRDESGLRGVGPLQMCGAAVSVAVEAQRWAAGFYAGGGVPPLIIKHAAGLDGTIGEDGLTEAQRLKAQWMAGDNNVPKVIDQDIDSIQQLDFNPAGAQMLEARQWDAGEAARMFGIPGTLLEYNMPGSSLTYQSVPDVWIEFLRGCLQPSYLEPVEAQYSDLLPRTQAGRFNVEGLQRADIKTRYDVYTAGIAAGVLTIDEARQAEGYLPGNIETMPVPPSPPQAVAGLSREVRCDGAVMIRGVTTRCNALLNRDGPFVGTCRKCKKVHAMSAPAPPERDTERGLLELAQAAVSRPLNVYNNFTIPPPPEINVTTPPVNVTTPEVTVQPHFDFAPAVTNVTVPPPEAINVTVGRQPTRKRIERDGTGLISFVVEE